MTASDKSTDIHGSGEAPANSAGQPRPVRERIVEALMALAQERASLGPAAWADIGIADIAQRADVSLAEFLGAYPSKGAVLGGFARMIDLKVLAAHASNDDDLGGEDARERLFDIVMMRLDHMAPYREALKTIVAGVRREPLTVAALNKAAQNSWRFMLVAAGVNTEGPLGALRVQGAALLFARTVEVWLDDDEPSQAKTLARLDRELERGGKLLSFADGVWNCAAPLRRIACAVVDRGSRRAGRHGARGGADDGAAADYAEDATASPAA